MISSSPSLDDGEGAFAFPPKAIILIVQVFYQDGGGYMTAVTAAHNVTTALQRAFAGMGVLDPLTGKPLTEAMLLGFGGGLGIGYILWEFKEHGSATIVTGFRHRWNYTAESAKRMCDRLNAPTDVLETGGAKAAAANLESALALGSPVPIWVDKASLPYQHLPERLKGYGVHVITVHELNQDTALVGDLSERMREISRADLAAARARIGSDKQRVLRITPPTAIDLPAAIRAGIADCVEHLSSPSESFSLPVLVKWGKMLTDTRNKKGWHTVFASRAGLFDTLSSVYEGIRLDDTEGAGLRDLYADFLDEAAAVLPTAEAAAAYRHAAACWKEFAACALPERVPALAKTRMLLEKRYAAFRNGDNAELSSAIHEFDLLRDAVNADFPMDAAAVSALFEEMQARLKTVYEAETAALETLRRLVM